jgi:3-isopropylmalate/(R)-2-methylmalate dehydratase large subunit
MIADRTARTLFDKIWTGRVIRSLGEGVDLLHVDRHLIHDLEAGPRLTRLEQRGLTVARPDLTFATPDHALPTFPGRNHDPTVMGAPLLDAMRKKTRAAGIRFFELGSRGQGIVHVVGPELGLSLPGLLIVCGDSHTCTHGGLGALAFGIGSSEVEHVLATQTIRQKRPKTLRLSVSGQLAPHVTAKDLILHAIGRFGTAAGRGYAVEYSGAAVRNLGVEARLTLCNLSIEFGSKIGMISPDEAIIDYLVGRPFAPSGSFLDQAESTWRELATDADAAFDKELSIDAADVTPQVTWGTSPQDVLPVSGVVPDPENETDAEKKRSMLAALDYMGLKPGQPIEGIPIDWVFIGSCTNGRLSDLRDAAAIARGRHVVPGVTAWVVPGSEEVRRAAEAEGLDKVFQNAGFEWREPGCSMCLAANGEVIGPGKRSVSTTNRNFVGRQGPAARTHLASPAMAAAAAVTGTIADVRKLNR